MPIKVPNDLPAVKTLAQENVMVMTENRASHQDIRPLKIVILNLMPSKNETELQLLRQLGGSPLQVDVDFLHVLSHTPKNTQLSHLKTFYKTFGDIRDDCYDGMIITGAPVETLPFSDVDYWPELCSIMEWSKFNVYSTFHICWGAQAALFYHYGIDKYHLGEKLSGIYAHRSLIPSHPLLWSFDEVYYAPHSRYTSVRTQDIISRPELRLLSQSEDAGAYIIAGANGRRIFVTGHSEYDRETLAAEYARDAAKGMNPKVPVNYFPQDNPDKLPVMKWRSHSNLLFGNWINFIIYPNTPYDLMSLNKVVTRPQMVMMM